MSIVLVAFYALIGKYLINLVAGIDFTESYSPMLFLLMGYLSYLIFFWTRHYLFLNNLILKHTVARLINVFVFIISSGLLIKNLSYNGIAISISLGMIAQKIYEIFAYYRNK